MPKLGTFSMCNRKMNKVVDSLIKDDEFKANKIYHKKHIQKKCQQAVINSFSFHNFDHINNENNVLEVLDQALSSDNLEPQTQQTHENFQEANALFYNT